MVLSEQLASQALSFVKVSTAAGGDAGRSAKGRGRGKKGAAAAAQLAEGSNEEVRGWKRPRAGAAGCLAWCAQTQCRAVLGHCCVAVYYLLQLL